MYLKKKLEYTVEQPVQMPLEMENPMVIYDKNTFYPEPSFFYRKNKDFITYPLKQDYTEYGLPTYTYPYETMNPIFNDPNQDGIGIEGFSNLRNNKTQIVCIIILFVILLMLLFM